SINGKPVALNGINYLPPKLLSSQMSSDNYDLIFEQIIDRKLNAIHVSGEGIYESEYFYDLADTKGIMILQDFMFPEYSYPSSQPFIENVEEEVTENINMLKQHPSLISWTGTFVGDSQHPNSALETIVRKRVKLLDPLRPLVHSGF